MDAPTDKEYIKPLLRRKPFKPSSGTCPFDDCDKLFPKIASPEKAKPVEVDTYFDELVDAETGEPIKLSNARWNAVEGRLNLDAKTILAMGTGKLNISNRDSADRLPPIPTSSSSPQRQQQSSQQRQQYMMQSDVVVRRHPLVTQYLLEGPMNPRFHRYWNVREDQVDLNDETRLDIMEEGVDYYDDGNISQLDAHNLTMMNEMNTNTSHHSGGSAGSRDGDTSTLGSSRVPSLQSSHFSTNYRGGTKNKHPHRHRTRSVSSGFGTNSSVHSRGSRGTSVSSNTDLQQKYTDPKLAWSNKEAWLALEEKIFQELFGLASQMETNKSLTLENRAKGGMGEVRKTCRQLSRWKVKAMKDVVQAVDDERRRDGEREQALIDNMMKSEETIHLLRKTHQEEIKKGKQYLLALQQDIEVAFMTKLNEAGFLW